MIPCNVRMRGIRCRPYVPLFECNCEIASNYIFKYIKYIMKVIFFTGFHAGRMHERQIEKHVSTIEFGWLRLGALGSVDSNHSPNPNNKPNPDPNLNLTSTLTPS